MVDGIFVSESAPRQNVLARRDLGYIVRNRPPDPQTDFDVSAAYHGCG